MSAAVLRATARPAFSMRLSMVTPRATLSRSSAALSAGVRTGSIRPVAPGSLRARAPPSSAYRETEGRSHATLVGEGHHDVRDAEGLGPGPGAAGEAQARRPGIRPLDTHVV